MGVIKANAGSLPEKRAQCSEPLAPLQKTETGNIQQQN